MDGALVLLGQGHRFGTGAGFEHGVAMVFENAARGLANRVRAPALGRGSNVFCTQIQRSFRAVP